MAKLQSSLRQFCGRHHDLASRYGIYVSQIPTDVCRILLSQSGSFLIHGISLICNKRNPPDATIGAGIDYPSGAAQIIPGFVLLDL